MAFQPTRGAPKTLRELYLWAWNNFSRLSRAGAEGDHDGLINRELPAQHPISAITSLQQVLDNKVTTGYGSAAGSGPLNDLTPGVFQRMPLSDLLVLQPVGVVFNFPNNTFRINFVGVWVLDIEIDIEFNPEIQATQRSIVTRLVNVTENQIQGVRRHSAGRDVSSLLVKTSIASDFVTDVADDWAVEISAEGSNFTSVNMAFCGVSMWQLASVSQV